MVHEYEMTLKFKLHTLDAPLDPGFAQALHNIFDDYEDGRYPFSVEMMQNGLSDCMRDAAHWLVSNSMIARYGNEVVESDDGRRRTSRWYLESQKAEPVVPYICEPPEVSIERT